MIDLNKVKTVLFDFDETLCVHEGHTTDVDNAAHIANFLECGMRHYDKRKKNIQMEKFIDLCVWKEGLKSVLFQRVPLLLRWKQSVSGRQRYTNIHLKTTV